MTAPPPEARSFPSGGHVLDGFVHRPDEAAGIRVPVRGTIVVAHPHPGHGGHMDHPVVLAAAERAAHAGLVALRFDFRGVRRSKGDVDDWVARSEALPFLEFVPVDNRIAIRSTQLGDAFHADPADRIIVATALTLGATVVTKDRRLRRYKQIETVWS